MLENNWMIAFLNQMNQNLDEMEKSAANFTSAGECFH